MVNYYKINTNTYNLHTLMSAIISPIHDIVELGLNLEPCILQKCNTFYFRNQMFFYNRYYYCVIWYVPVNPMFIKIYQCIVLLKMTATCSHSTEHTDL